MVTVLSCMPIFPVELKVTLICPLSPFFIGSFGQTGTVQPHEPCASEMISGSLPTLEKLKSYVMDSPCLIVPKSYVSTSNLNSPAFGLSCTAGAAVAGDVGAA